MTETPDWKLQLAREIMENNKSNRWVILTINRMQKECAKLCISQHDEQAILNMKGLPK